MAVHPHPTRRATDRIEDVAAWVLMAAGLLVVLLSCGFGIQVHNQYLERARVAAASGAPGVARLTADAPMIGSRYTSGIPVMVDATWQDRTGALHSGLVSAAQGQRAGSIVAVWIDASGTAVQAPPSADVALPSGLVAGGIALGAATVVLLGLWLLVHRLTMAANCARWEREWRAVGPIWSGHWDIRG